MSTQLLGRSEIWRDRLARNLQRVERLGPPPIEGYLTRMIGQTLEATGCQAAVGDYCDVLTSSGSQVETEVVGFSGDRLFLMPTGDMHGLEPNARVVPRQRAGTVRVGPELLAASSMAPGSRSMASAPSIAKRACGSPAK